MIVKGEDHLEHYGILRRSGRYPWGSGGTQNARNKSFLDVVNNLKKDGLSETEIARGFGITTTQLRAAKTIALNQQRLEKISQAQRLKDKGYSNVAIGQRMGINESSVRALLAPGAKDRVDVLQSTANMLKDQVEKKGYIDIGAQVEKSLPLSDGGNIGISKDKFNTAVAMLREEGYKVHYFKVTQAGTGHETTVKVLSKGDAPFPKADQIKSITAYSKDGGHKYFDEQPPISISSKRIAVKYAEDGGGKADGLIFVRPGKDDLSIGSSHYAQVRIAVDGTHYLKGMAVYKDDLPAGVDLVFNTNKHNTGNKKDAFKKMEDDPRNPFGTDIKRQIHDAHGKVKSAMNIVNEEGDWDKWSRSLPAQFLSKQQPSLAKAQLAITQEKRLKEFDRISKLTNPTVRKKLLETFADETDSAAVHLKAAAINQRQAHKVILPIASLKEGEIYAPSLRNGERVALVRFPHAGTFEIPQLTVNNRNKEAQKLLGKQAIDAVGIHHKVAERLSGADFDGDSVLAIPNNRKLVKSTDALEGLKGFDPQSYKIPEGSGIPHITPSHKQHEMGDITNLIQDMTIRGASTEELARAVRHSMVVIDSEKHGLDYKRSARDNGIAQLKTKYQGKARAGASTLITRGPAKVKVNEKKPRPAALGGPIDKATGKKVFVETGRTYVNRKGEEVKVKRESRRLAETHDALSLIKGTPTPIEHIYAEHSNKLKSLANQARKEMVHTKTIPYSPSARKAYHKEVASLHSKLNVALKNAPLERQAQLIANARVSQIRRANPDMDASDLKKVKNRALEEARARTGARKQRIGSKDLPLTQAEWNAIQAGAISNHKLEQIISNSDLETIKKFATPKVEVLMTSGNQARAASMLARGFTQAEVADALGVSLSTLKASING